MRRRTLASKYSSKRPASTSGRCRAHQALSSSVGTKGGPLMEMTARARSGMCAAIHSESAPPMDAPPHTASRIPSPSSHPSRSSALRA